MNELHSIGLHTALLRSRLLLSGQNLEKNRAGDSVGHLAERHQSRHYSKYDEQRTTLSKASSP